MAWIDQVVRSNVFVHFARAMMLAYGTMGTAHYAKSHPQTRLERVVYQTAATLFTSLALEGLPRAAFKGTLIGAALPWAPVAFGVAALATAYFAPEKTHLPLQAVEITTVALAAFAALAAPSAVTLGTLGLLGVATLQMRNIPNVSAPIAQVMKLAGGALTAIGMLWAIKGTVLSFTIQYSLYALAFGAVSLYVAIRTSRRAEARPKPKEIAQLTQDQAKMLEDLYMNKLGETARALMNSKVADTYKERTSTTGANTIEISQAIYYKWLQKCTDEGKRAALLGKIGNQPEMPEYPRFTSLTEAWIYGTFTHSADDPKDLMGLLYTTLGQGNFVEKFIRMVHERVWLETKNEYFKTDTGKADFKAYKERHSARLKQGFDTLIAQKPRAFLRDFKEKNPEMTNAKKAYDNLVKTDPKSFYNAFVEYEFWDTEPHFKHLFRFSQGISFFRES